MAEISKIEWTDATFNGWIGCTKISPGCDNCYAEALSQRYGWAKWGDHARKRTSTTNWQSPVKWNAEAKAFEEKHGRRRRVFSASLSDWLDNQVPKEWRRDLCALIEQTPDLDWLMLTKRIQNYRKLAPENWQSGPPANVWLGITAESAEYYQRRMPNLASIPAAVRFVSYEPAVGPLGDVALDHGKPDWIIIGGESGQSARPMRPQWARDVIAQCEAHRIAPFLKQWGTYASNPLCQEQGIPATEAQRIDRAGKGGGMLDGKLYRAFPRTPPLARRHRQIF
jgi:protein gp37